MAGVRLADYGLGADQGDLNALAAQLADVSLTADAALSTAQSASSLAGLAATQIDLNATIDDLNNPLKPRVYRWVSYTITQDNIPLGAGSSHDFTLAGPQALPGAFLPVAIYFQSDAVAESSDPATTSLLAKVGAAPVDPFLYLTSGGVDLIASYGRITGPTGPQLGGIVKTDLIMTLDAGSGDLAHISALAIRVVVDYTVPGEGA